MARSLKAKSRVELVPTRTVVARVTLQTIRKHALDTFGTPEKAQQWLNRSNPLFDGKTPLQVTDTDPLSVEAELVRIDYGVYV